MAYGVNAPFGLQPRYYLGGSTWNNQTRQYRITSAYGTSLFTGDPVTLLANGVIGIATAGDGNPILGSFQGVEWYDVNGNYNFSAYWTAGTAVQAGGYATAFVTDDPNIIYSIQVSINGNPANAIGATIADLNSNANWAIGANPNSFNAVNGPGGAYTPPSNPLTGSTTTGKSAVFLDQATIATGNATRALKIVDFEPNPTPTQVPYANNGGIITGVFNNVLVIINNHPYKGGTGTVGV